MEPADSAQRDAFLAYVRCRVPSAWAAVKPPDSSAGWDRRLAEVRKGLRGSFGRIPAEPCPLEPEVLGTLEREGYAIDRLTFQSRPGVRVTANVYRPTDAPGPFPAVLSVHGHWAWARIDEHVQARCIGLARLGYLCLCVDAMGAGERAIKPEPGAYHGGLVGASLWPAGVPLLGLQVYDNRRAVDYLVSRPDVDAAKLAITGASGGGNQTLYAGATDERFAAVVPVCGVGTYESYLGAACCICEVNAGGLTYATTGDILAMVAPRALLVINATRDAVQFSVAEAAKSVAYARVRYQQLDVADKIRHLPVESGHDYNQPMREALYGWLDRWLRGQGDGSPRAEPAIKLEDPAVLRCYPDGVARPKAIVTIPEFAFREGQARLAALPGPPDHPEAWQADAERMRAKLVDDILGGLTAGRARGERSRVEFDEKTGSIALVPEPGIVLRGRVVHAAEQRPGGRLLLLRAEGQAPADDALVKQLVARGWLVLTADLRATGQGKPATSTVAGVADHNEAEWALWIGRPLLGQWTGDAIAWLDSLAGLPKAIGGAGEGPSDAKPAIAVAGVGHFGLAALLAGALSDRANTIAVSGCLVSFVGEGPWVGVPMGLIAPNILEVGDIGHLAALAAPKRLLVAGGVEPDGSSATGPRLQQAFAYTRAVYRANEAADRLTIEPASDLARLLGGPPAN